MGVSLRPSHAERETPASRSIEQIIEDALGALRNEGELDKHMHLRYGRAVELVVLDTVERFHVKPSAAWRLLALTAGALIASQGALSGVMLAANGILDHEERYQQESDRLIIRLEQLIQKLRAIGVRGEARATERAEKIRKTISSWDNDFWRERTLDRYEREIRPLLKGEPQQRPRMVAMPQEGKS